MPKQRSWYGVSVPADLKDERHVRTFMEHVCDALEILAPPGASASGTSATYLYQARQVFYGSEDGRLAQNAAFTFNAATGGLTVPRLGLTGTNGASALGPVIFQTTSAALTATAVAGALECDGDYLYYTDTVPVRHQLAYQDTQYWSRDSASGTLYPRTIADLVSIGATTAPYNSANLGLWSRMGLAHCNVTAAAGAFFTQWVAYASATSAEQSIADEIAGTTGRDVVRVGTDTANIMTFMFNGLPAFTLGSNGTSVAILPSDAGQLFSIGGGTSHERIYSCHIQTGTPQVGLFFDGSTVAQRMWLGSSDSSSHIHSSTTGNALYVGAGSTTCHVYFGGSSSAGTAGSFTVVAKLYRLSASSILRWLPGSDGAVDLGGATGATDDERWRDIYRTAKCHILQGTGADCAGRAHLVNGTVTVNTTAALTNSQLRLTRSNVGASTALGHLSVGNIVNATSFVINALVAATVLVEAGDQSYVDWEIVEALA